MTRYNGSLICILLCLFTFVCILLGVLRPMCYVSGSSHQVFVAILWCTPLQDTMDPWFVSCCVCFVFWIYGCPHYHRRLVLNVPPDLIYVLCYFLPCYVSVALASSCRGNTMVWFVSCCVCCVFWIYGWLHYHTRLVLNLPSVSRYFPSCMCILHQAFAVILRCNP